MSTFRQSACGPAATIAVGALAVSFVPLDFTGARQPYFRVQVQDAAVIVTYDGTEPTSSNGEIIQPGAAGYFLREDLFTMQFLQVTSAAKVFAQPSDLISPANG